MPNLGGVSRVDNRSNKDRMRRDTGRINAEGRRNVAILMWTRTAMEVEVALNVELFLVGLADGRHGKKSRHSKKLNYSRVSHKKSRFSFKNALVVANY